MEDIDDISDQIIEVDRHFYKQTTINTTNPNSTRFCIPVQIRQELNLKAGDVCYFCKYVDGYFISFNHKPASAIKGLYKSRKLSAAGAHDSLYLRIPQFITNLYQERITEVELLQIKGFQPYEWQIQFLSTECI